jgi:hypothetical protein
MQDWVLLTGPLAAVLYFLAFQDQFRQLLSWVSTLVNQAAAHHKSAALTAAADMQSCGCKCRYAPESDCLLRCREMSRWAKSDMLHRKKQRALFSVSYKPSCGISLPGAVAVYQIRSGHKTSCRAPHGSDRTAKPVRKSGFRPSVYS